MLIAGGGTGGHLYPGMALAEEFLLRDQHNQVLFVGTRQGLEAKELPRAGYQLATIQVGGMKRRGMVEWIRGVLRQPRAMWQSRGILKKFRPHVVVGVGGYASGPVLLTAWLMRLPTAVLEQNALPGFTNRLLGKFVRCVFVAFPQAATFFRSTKVRLLGNPVRRSIVNDLLAKPEFHQGLHLLVFGGSQGAEALNRMVPEAVARLQRCFDQLVVVHQTGERQCDQVKQRYQQLGASDKVQVLPFIRDMASAYRQADVVVSRAGAITIAELSLCRRPAVLVPFPYAADNHQEVNARVLVNVGAAVMIRQSELTSEKLAEELSAILASPEQRVKMQEAAGRTNRPGAARYICDCCLELAQRSRWLRKAGG